MTVERVNHVVLWVSDVKRSADFYCSVLGLSVIEQHGDEKAFLRSPVSPNHHDLGLFRADFAEGTVPGAPGMYHTAWQCDSLIDLVGIRERLVAAGAFLGGTDHGATKSLYAKDPDGLEFEVMWLTPKETWAEGRQPFGPLDLEDELRRADHGCDNGVR
ncbi:VOC family protein [Streptomyces erythrochromogenes]|uniref:VOC family protein n=1 Tax=Streptomyces erythrochromogenes TaxID=285574 RepID=UPI003809D132